MPMPAPEMLADRSAPEKYDDTEVHSKLDQLIGHATDAGRAGAEVAMLEDIREQVKATSIQLNDFVAAQQAAMLENNNTKAREAEEAAIALEKRTAQKETVEMDIVKLSGEREALHNDVQSLIKEKDELAAVKSRMQADLSSLETALQIRREELHVMEARADGLERRILDGILDHSRSLLTTSRPQSSLKEMNLKRVTSVSSNATTSTRASTVLPSHSSAASSGVGMAMKRRPPPKAFAPSSTTSKDRRILSLSTLSANKGLTNDRSMMLAQPSIAGGTTKATTIGAGGMKRSHSVKSNFPSRKPSWSGAKQLVEYPNERQDNQEDKENSILDEADEDGVNDEEEGSQADTERRTSYSGTYTATDSYGDGSVISDDKRLSYDASTIGTIGTRDFAFAETEDGHSNHGGEEVEERPRHHRAPPPSVDDAPPPEPATQEDDQHPSEEIPGPGEGLYIAKEAYQVTTPTREMVVFWPLGSPPGASRAGGARRAASFIPP